MPETNTPYRDPLDTSTNMHDLLTSLSSINVMETFAEVALEQRAGKGYAKLTKQEMQAAVLDIWPWVPKAIRYFMAFPEEIPTMTDAKIHAMFKGEESNGAAERIRITALRLIEEHRTVIHLHRA